MRTLKQLCDVRMARNVGFLPTISINLTGMWGSPLGSRSSSPGKPFNACIFNDIFLKFYWLFICFSLGLCCRVRAFSSCCVPVSHCGGSSYCRARAPEVVLHRLSCSPACEIFSKWSEVKVTQLCLTFCDPMDCTVHGILQARIL